MRAALCVVALLLLAGPRAAAAQVRIEAHTSTVTASGPPASVWFTLINDGAEPVSVHLHRLVHVLADGRREVLRWDAVEVDQQPARSPVVVPARGRALVVAYVTGFAPDEIHDEYRVSVTVRAGGQRVHGHTRIRRAIRRRWEQ
jgi:hypothetical protein